MALSHWIFLDTDDISFSASKMFWSLLVTIRPRWPLGSTSNMQPYQSSTVTTVTTALRCTTS